MVKYMCKTDIYEILRRNIIYYRKQKNLTQKELADKMDIDYGFLRKVESKKVKKNLSLDNVMKAAEVLEVDLPKFFEKRDEL